MARRGFSQQSEGAAENMHFLRIYIVPGLIFQSVVIGGGYATGRELIEFFAAAGPVGGMLGLLVAGAVFSAVIAVSFEFARLAGAYDYRHFCKALLGPFWRFYEIAYILLLVLVLSVIGSAAGEIAADAFGWPTYVGILVLAAAIAGLTFGGSETIARVFSVWSVLLYAVYILMFVFAFRNFGARIVESFAQGPVGAGWLGGGIRYAGYNLALVPVILFAIGRHKRRRETLGAGLAAGALAVIPALLFYAAMMGRYPEIVSQTAPSAYLLGELGVVWLEIAFQIVVFGTFIETGAGLLHAVNERVAANFADRGRALPRAVRPLVAGGLLLVSIFAAAAVGIVGLIAKGYGYLTYAFIAILIIPVMTIGLARILRAGSPPQQGKRGHAS